jgi:hypothetical protein
LGWRSWAGDDAFCSFGEPLESAFGTSPAKALLHIRSEIIANPQNTQRMMDRPGVLLLICDELLQIVASETHQRPVRQAKKTFSTLSYLPKAEMGGLALAN